MSERAGGQVLNGRYALQGVLGGGGMAQVFRARDNLLGRLVAIKVLRDQYSQDPNFVQRFQREAQASANLVHPNIASVYDVGEDNGLHYIVMELVQGETLRDLISRDAPLPPDRAVEIAAQVLAALEYAHRNGLIHRDIKPGNVLITPEGMVKVVDFGIAKGASDLSLTGAGLALGTAAYFSPEQAKGERVLPQSDLYAVGVTLYEMLTGRVPFESDTDVGLAFKHVSEQPIPPRQLNPSIPPQIERIVMRALAKDPAQRFASALQMEQALRNYAAFGAQQTAAMPTMQPARPPAGPRQAVPVVGYPPRPMPVAVQPARRGAGVQVNTSNGGSSFMTWILGLVALLLLLGAAVLALNAPGFLNRGNPTATLIPPTRSLPGVSTAVSTNRPTDAAATAAPTQAPTQQPTQAPTDTAVPPTASATNVPPTDTAVPPSATAVPVVVPAPNFTSLTLADAQGAAQQNGLIIQQSGTAEDANHPEGTIITQDPQPGVSVPLGSVIKVVVSTGPHKFAMPSVINTDGNGAAQYLQGQGLKVTVQQEPSATIQEGAVSRQDPDPGTEVKVGDTVTIWVSQGDLVNVPDVTTQSEADGVAALKAAGLAPQVVYMGQGQMGLAITQVDPGQIFQTDPAGGAQARRNSRVTVIVRQEPVTPTP